LPCSELGPGNWGLGYVDRVVSSGSQCRWGELLGRTQVRTGALGKWGAGWLSPGSCAYREPAAGDFPAQTWRGEAWKGLEGLYSEAPQTGHLDLWDPQRDCASWKIGLWKGKALLRAPHPQMPPASCPTAKDSQGHTDRARPQLAGHLWGMKTQIFPEPLCPLPQSLGLGNQGQRWAPREGQGRIRAVGGSFGERGEQNRKPASRRRTREPGDPAIDSNREAAVYSNTAPPGPSPGDAAQPGAPSAPRGRPPSPLPRGSGLPGPAAAAATA
jgi:hypothetical protein